MPSLSPDGSRIVYRSSPDGGLFIAETYGGEKRKLVPHGALPRFSRDDR
jgi:Tol biopolymer transport system component